jgi:hypothetical protein
MMMHGVEFSRFETMRVVRERNKQNAAVYCPTLCLCSTVGTVRCTCTCTVHAVFQNDPETTLNQPFSIHSSAGLNCQSACHDTEHIFDKTAALSRQIDELYGILIISH